MSVNVYVVKKAKDCKVIYNMMIKIAADGSVRKEKQQ